MRYPTPISIVLPTGQLYTDDNFLRETVWPAPEWSENETSIATFERVTTEWNAARKESRAPAFEDADYATLLAIMRSAKYPPHVSLELANLRNHFVLASREAPKPMRVAKKVTDVVKDGEKVTDVVKDGANDVNPPDAKA